MRAVRRAVATGAIAIVTLTGCAFAPQVVSDYDYYGSVEALDEAATVIIRGTVLATRDGAITSRPFEGTDPATNPHVGLPASERPNPSGLVSSMTIYQVRIDDQYQGRDLVRGSVNVMQPGPVASTSRSDESLEVGAEYVLFLLVEQRYRTEPAGIVGGPQGTFLIDQNGALTQQFAANAGDGLTEEETVSLDWQQLEALRE